MRDKWRVISCNVINKSICKISECSLITFKYFPMVMKRNTCVFRITSNINYLKILDIKGNPYKEIINNANYLSITDQEYVVWNCIWYLIFTIIYVLSIPNIIIFSFITWTKILSLVCLFLSSKAHYSICKFVYCFMIQYIYVVNC